MRGDAGTRGRELKRLSILTGNNNKVRVGSALTSWLGRFISNQKLKVLFL